MCLPLCQSDQSSESSDFMDVYDEESFPVGSAELWWQGSEEVHSSMIYYPANESGSSTPVDNASGPFPYVVWLVDEGEESSNYDWIGNAVASSGYIFFVLPQNWNSDETDVLITDLLYLNLRISDANANGSDFPDPENMQDAFDVEHWGLGGHGLGAIQAAYAQRCLANPDGPWFEHTHSLPRALVGLGLDRVNINIPATYLGDAPEPGMALYLTGSVDEITEPELNIERFLDDSEDSYHYIEVSGANHVQYQDEIGWWEGFNDGDAQMSQADQQSHAINHILPYYNLILKGSHEDWRNATNRELDWVLPSDQNGFPEEDLNNANFFQMSLPIGTNVSEYDSTSGREVSATVRVLHRDGQKVENITVNCEVIGYSGTSATGSFIHSSSSGPWSEASCSAPTDGVEPGNQTMRLSVNWYGMPSRIDLPFHRENRQPVLSSPLPVINIPQHGQGGLNFSEIATDPDGLELVVEYSSHSESNHIGVFPFTDESNPWDITLWHQGTPEWAGSGLLNLTVVDPFDPPFSMNVSIQVNVLPVDDPIVQINTIPPFEMQEDEGPRSLSMAGYFEDPEGGIVGIESVTPVDGLTFSIEGVVLTIEGESNWNGQTVVEFLMSDGSTEPITAFFDLTVTAVTDVPRLNVTTISGILEDDPIEIPLEELGWDEDGDEVQFRVDGGDQNLSISVLNDVLRIVPNADWAGVSRGWNFTIESGDGTSSVMIDIFVEGVDDPTFVEWGDLSSITNDQIRIPFAVYDPDGDLPWDVRYRWDSGNWVTLNSTCTTLSESDWICELWVPTVGLLEGSHRLDAQVSEGENWTKEQSMYLSIAPSSSTENLDDQSGSSESKETPFSIVTVLMITGVVVVLIIAIYMVTAISRSDDELLSDEELENLLDFD